VGDGPDEARGPAAEAAAKIASRMPPTCGAISGGRPLRRRRLGVLGVVAALAVVPPAAADAVRWSGRTFASQGDLAAWLSARGAKYETWAERHPPAAARLEGRGYARSTSPATRRVPDIVERAREAPAPAPPDRAEGAPRLSPRSPVGAVPLLPLLLAPVAGLVLVLLALAVPAPAVPASRLGTHRLGLAAAGASIAVGCSLGLAVAFAL
jgi:hypothetical protein